MPGAGNRSGGCYSCRGMKVKCDERRPGCFRCEKAGRTCPGYREELDIFRSMNETAESKVLDMRVKRRKSREPRTPSTGSSLSGERLTLTVASSSAGPSTKSSSPPVHSASLNKHRSHLAPPMAEDWDAQAIFYFFDAFTIQPDAARSSPGYYDWLSELYFESPQDSYLIDAAKAAAFMFLSKRSCLQSFAVQARRSYGKALMQASSNLNILEEAKSDRMIATLVLLGVYEVICGEKRVSSGWETHANGQAMVLRIRGEEQFKCARSRAMFRSVNMVLQQKDLRLKRPPERSMSDWPDNVFPSQPERDAVRLFDKVATIQYRGWSLVEESRNGTTLTADMLVLLQDAQIVDQELQDWRDSTPSPWRPWTTPNYSPSPSASPSPHAAMQYPKQIYLFHSYAVAKNWSWVHTSSVLLLQMMLEINSTLAASGMQLPPALAQSVLQTRLIQSIDSICNSVPYMLGEVDNVGRLQFDTSGRAMSASLILWPLHIITQVKDLDDSYFTWILEQIYRIGTITGYTQSLKLEKYHLRRQPSFVGADPSERFDFDV